MTSHQKTKTPITTNAPRISIISCVLHVQISTFHRALRLTLRRRAGLHQSPVANCCTSDASFSYSTGRPALLSIGALLPPPSRFKRISRVRCIRPSLNYSDAHTTPAPAIKGRGYFFWSCASHGRSCTTIAAIETSTTQSLNRMPSQLLSSNLWTIQK